MSSEAGGGLELAPGDRAGRYVIVKRINGEGSLLGAAAERIAGAARAAYQAAGPRGTGLVTTVDEWLARGGQPQQEDADDRATASP